MGAPSSEIKFKSSGHMANTLTIRSSRGKGIVYGHLGTDKQHGMWAAGCALTPELCPVPRGVALACPAGPPLPRPPYPPLVNHEDK